MKSEISISEAIKLLDRACFMGQATQQDMLNLIENVERQHSTSDSAELHFLLGLSLECYSAWFVKGDKRKPFLQNSVEHLERALSIEEHKSGTKRNDYAVRLGWQLVEEAQIRDIPRAIDLLQSVFESVADFVPHLCSYPEALYQLGDYLKSAEVAIELNRRATLSRQFVGQFPTAPMQMAAKAYRALARQLKKDGKLLDALSVSSKLLETGFATENDMQIHKKLADLAKANTDSEVRQNGN